MYSNLSRDMLNHELPSLSPVFTYKNYQNGKIIAFLLKNIHLIDTLSNQMTFFIKPMNLSL